MSAAGAEVAQHGILVYRNGRTRALTTDGYQPLWSPDGRLIAFIRDGTVRGHYVHELWVMRPDGSGKRRLLQRRVRNFRDLEWSPDSRKIVFTSNTGSALDTVRRDGSGYHRLIRNGENPAHSPDGEQLVFSRPGARGCFVSALWIMRADGTRARMLRSPGGGPVCGDEPDWQPLPR
jgi:hypothetical protein